MRWDFKMAVRLPYLVLCVCCTVLLIIVARTMMFSHDTAVKDPCTPTDVDYISANEEVIRRFSKGISFRTVSYDAGNYERDELFKFQKFILEEYSSIFNHPLVKLDIIANFSLLIRVGGSDSTLKPFMIASHLDVVDASNASWEVPPFEGRVQDGYLWGRGTIDDKNGVMGSLEALQFLLRGGYTPKRTFYLAFGHDEEVQGHDGAKNIAAFLESQNIQLEFLVDEGTTVLEGFIPGFNLPYAVIGVVEKGFMTLELSVHTQGGHSSMPPVESCIGILSQAVTRLESCPMPAKFQRGGALWTMFETLAPKMPLPLRTVIANLWLFSPILTRVLGMKPSTNALLRTTTAVTKFNAGIKANVIPTSAKALVNHRIHPRNTIEEVIEHDKKCINDNRVNVKVINKKEPSPFSRWDKNAFGYQMVSRSVRQVFPNISVTPGLMIANTDTKHYLHLTDAVYRFMPTVLRPEDTNRIHGFNERISVDNYEKTINYFYHLMLNADAASLENTKSTHGEL